MEISARNKIKGTIKEIKIGSVMARVLLEVAGGERINSMITIDSVNDLNLKVGDEVFAVVKSTDVMIAK